MLDFPTDLYISFRCLAAVHNRWSIRRALAGRQMTESAAVVSLLEELINEFKQRSGETTTTSLLQQAEETTTTYLLKQQAAITTSLLKQAEATTTALLAKFLEQQAELTMNFLAVEKMTNWLKKLHERQTEILEIVRKDNLRCYPLDSAFWSTVERTVPKELYDVTPIVNSFTMCAFELLQSGLTAGAENVQPRAHAMIGELIRVANKHWSLELTLCTEGPCFGILDVTRIYVMSWEFKNLNDDLEGKHIAQLIASMSRGINYICGMKQQSMIGFLTTGRQWVVVTATRTGGKYRWVSTPILSTLYPVLSVPHRNTKQRWLVDADACKQVAKFLCFAFSNAMKLHDDAAANFLKSLEGLDWSGPDSRL
jgi:hypothetical protein